jgi:hypothetical protein
MNESSSNPRKAFAGLLREGSDATSDGESQWRHFEDSVGERCGGRCPGNGRANGYRAAMSGNTGLVSVKKGVDVGVSKRGKPVFGDVFVEL